MKHEGPLKMTGVGSYVQDYYYLYGQLALQGFRKSSNPPKDFSE